MDIEQAIESPCLLFYAALGDHLEPHERSDGIGASASCPSTRKRGEDRPAMAGVLTHSFPTVLSVPLGNPAW